MLIILSENIFGKTMNFRRNLTLGERKLEMNSHYQGRTYKN